MDGAPHVTDAVDLGHKLGYVLLATADASGFPNLAVANVINRVSEDKLTISSWFCPATVANLRRNPRLDVIVWDSDTDQGYQILGTAEQVTDIAVLDGYTPERPEPRARVAQTEREVTVKVEKVFSFARAPYCDMDSGGTEV